MRKIIFHTIFFLVYLFGGLIYILGFNQFRMNLVSLLVLPLLTRNWVKWGAVFYAFLGLIVVSLISTIINQTSVTSMILFLRSIGFAVLIYALVKIYANEKNSRSLFKLSLWVGLIQLPVVIIQQTLLYKALSGRLSNISITDFDFGTFNYKGDPVLAFFLVLLVVFLLFDPHRDAVIDKKRQMLAALWLTATILIINSNMGRLIVVFIWLVYLIIHVRFALILQTSLATLVVLAFIVLVGFSEQTRGMVTSDLALIAGNDLPSNGKALNQYITGRYSPALGFFMMRVANFGIHLQNSLIAKPDVYLMGKASRAGALALFIDQGISWFGDGPGIYEDVLNRTLSRGNTGHIFTYYSEVGVLGLLISYLVFYLIAKEDRPRLGLSQWMILLAVFLMSFTVDVFNNIGIFLAFCIFILGTKYLGTEPLPSEDAILFQPKGEITHDVI